MSKTNLPLVFIGLFVFSFINFSNVQAQVIMSTIPDSRSGYQTSQVENTGIDAMDNGAYKLKAIVNDGSRPQLVTELTGAFPFLNSLPSTAIDPDVAIFNDANIPSDFYIDVTYYNTALSRYVLDIYYLNALAPSVPTALASYNLMTSPFGSGANIDVSDDGLVGCVTFENSGGTIYGVIVNIGAGVPSTPCVVAKGTKPDVAVAEAGDVFLFSYIKNSTTISVTGIAHPDLAACNSIKTTINFNGTDVDEPRIANNGTGNGSWGVVWLDHQTGDLTNTVFGNIASLIILSPPVLTAGVTNKNYTNSNTWTTVPSAPFDFANTPAVFHLFNPVISFNRQNDIQVGFVAELVGANMGIMNCGNSLAIGVVCDNTGEPVTISSQVTPNYQQIPFPMSPSSCPPSPAFNSTGVSYTGFQSAISMAGKNTNSNNNEFVAAYFDNTNCINNCGNEVVYKESYSSSSGFRTLKPKTENSVLNNKTLKLMISPNPFTENITITSTNNEAVCNLIISDISGRQILNTSGTNEQLNSALAVCNSKLNAGIYFINIKNDSGILLNQKIVKQ